MEVEHEQAPRMREPVIKVEPDDDSSLSDDQNIPCISTVPVHSATENADKLYYFPSQAVFQGREPLSPSIVSPSQKSASSLKAADRWTQKRKTIEALAQGAILNVAEPMIFEELISYANTKITLYDTKTKTEVPRPEKSPPEKSKASSTVTSPSLGGATTEMKFPQSRSLPYSTRSDENSMSVGGQIKRTVGLATVNPVTATCAANAPSMFDIYVNNSKTCGRPTENQLIAPPARLPPLPTPAAGPTLQFTIAGGAGVTSPPEMSSIGNHQILAPGLATPNVITSSRTLPSNSVRPELSKTAVCNPTNLSKTTAVREPQNIYVPKEIKVAPTELKLDECVNVNAICDKELTKWTAEDVATFVRETDCSEYADAFIDQEIDGKALTLLNQELLIQWMKLKLGPAMKLYSHIANLKHALNNAK